ncbi:MAG: carboxypeptidase-like regulatory domain-containing protein, partial [Chitinophagaceae bacterium]|nr:carboxypeptidase-like regulatory domain-containing protein [Chitinophagaceae bacterium]
MKKIFLQLFFMLFFIASNIFVFAQEKKAITGFVKDSSGNGISGVTVKEKGSAGGSTTDANGSFSIRVKSNATLVFSSIGYITREMETGANKTINIELVENKKELSEVVVTALGISKQKRQLGFSITEVKGDVLAKTNEVNPVNALQGRIA